MQGTVDINLNYKDIKPIFSTLPKEVIAHSKRMNAIVKFMVCRFEIEDFYIDLQVNQESLSYACLYHDIGKCDVNKEYLFRELCNSPYDVHRYMQHVEIGLQTIVDENIEQYIVEHPNNFKAYFYQILKYHHGPVRNKFPIIGQIAYVADTIDNSFFKVASNSIVDFDERSFESVMKKLMLVYEKDNIHPDILKIFREEEFLLNLREFLLNLYKKSTMRTHYGLWINEYNIYDIFRKNDASILGIDESIFGHQVFARKIVYNIRTRYYGKVEHDHFIFVALKNKLAKKLDGSFMTYLPDSLKDSYENLPVLTFISISVDSINKLTVKKLVKISEELNIPHEKLGVLIDFYYDELTPAQKAAIISLKQLDFKVAFNQARAEYINLFKEVSFDYAFYNNSSISEVDESFADLVQSLGITVILSQENGNKYRYVCSNNPNFRKFEKKEGDDIVGKEES